VKAGVYLVSMVAGGGFRNRKAGIADMKMAAQQAAKFRAQKMSSQEGLGVGDCTNSQFA
jgi:hypothetical protein